MSEHVNKTANPLHTWITVGRPVSSKVLTITVVLYVVRYRTNSNKNVLTFIGGNMDR